MKRGMFLDMWRCRRGATAIEYGLLVGGVAMVVGVAVFALGGNIGGVIGDLGGRVSGGGDTVGDVADMRVILNQTFANDREGWSGLAPVRTVDQLGAGLSLASESRLRNAGEAVSRTFDIPAGSARAEISFDMSFVDSWDGEQAKVYVNGTEVIVGSYNWTSDAPPSLSQTPTGGMTVETEMTNSPQGGVWQNGTLGTDYTYRVTIAVDDPGETVQLGVGTSLDQIHTDESLLIGNVQLRAGTRAAGDG